jgi:hypothetical protein
MTLNASLNKQRITNKTAVFIQVNVSFQVLTAAIMKMAVFWVFTQHILAIALMMEAASISETSVNFYQTTQRNNPEDSHLLSGWRH